MYLDFFSFFVPGLLLVMILASAIKIVPEYERGVVFFLGRFLNLIHVSNHQEYGKSDDQKTDNVIDENAQIDGHGTGFGCCFYGCVRR